ncbi:MAG: glycosyltransferase family 4 protein [Deltaproteobacteria bacterium]|jgi:glycosyltransferase involved in cell wall biosynthesis|nr:glycosyltransferase family 4 protein [Deltaproteobacteria bacterium]
MRLGFYTEGLPFEGDTLEKRALGGSETAFIEITRSLAKLGHSVTVFNNCEKTAFYDGVTYHPFRQSLAILARTSFDVMVVSRFFGFFNLPIKATLKVLWNHDTLENPSALRAIQDEIDIFFMLSRFHRDNYLTRLPLLDGRMVLTRNGLNLDLIKRASHGVCKDPLKLIYASRPERGLKILLENIWPRLLNFNPDLRLYLCGYEVDRNQLNPELLSLYDYLDLVVKTDPKIVILGALPKIEYYRHLAQAALLVYPCIFPEISCIVSLEAQALATPILTSNSYALSESVVTEKFKVPGKPGTSNYIQNFVERAITLLSHREKTQELANLAQEKILAYYSWDKIALEWERIFSLSLRAREMKKSGNQGYLRKNRD